MDNETYTCDSHLALQHIVSAMTYYLNNSSSKTELAEKVIKAERRKMLRIILPQPRLPLHTLKLK